MEQVGLQEADENDPVAPEGRPEAEKETAWLLPETKAPAIVLLTEAPTTTDWSPEFDSEKSKGGVTLNDALAWALGLYPDLNAAAFMTALLVNVIAPV